MSAPTRSYLVCATPGSGSVQVCNALAATGIAGWPEEYFEAHRYPGRPRGPREDFLGVLDRSTHDHLSWAFATGTTPNGVFGAKLMWGHFADLVGALRTIPAYRDLPLAELFPSVFPKLRFVRVTRKDTLVQATSLWEGMQAAGLSLRAPTPADLQQQILAEEESWDRFFADCDVEPLPVDYERFLADRDSGTRNLLEGLGLSAPRQPVFGRLPDRQPVAA